MAGTSVVHVTVTDVMAGAVAILLITGGAGNGLMVMVTVAGAETACASAAV